MKGWGSSWCVPSCDVFSCKCLTQLRGDRASPEWFALEQAPELCLSIGWHKCWCLTAWCKQEQCLVLHLVIVVPETCDWKPNIMISMDREHVSDRDTCSREIFFLASVCSPLTTAGGVLRSVTNKSSSYREVRQVPVLLQDRKTFLFPPGLLQEESTVGWEPFINWVNFPLPVSPKIWNWGIKPVRLALFVRTRYFFSGDYTEILISFWVSKHPPPCYHSI